MKAKQTECPRNIPNKPGTYWARHSASTRWYPMIVEVKGESPWFKAVVLANMLEAYDGTYPPKGGSCGDSINPESLYWGPELSEIPLPEIVIT